MAVHPAGLPMYVVQCQLATMGYQARLTRDYGAKPSHQAVLELAGHRKGAEVQREQAQVEDSGDKGQHAHHHRKVCQKMMIRELLMWKKPPEALEVEELGCKASWPDQRTFWLTP